MAEFLAIKNWTKYQSASYRNAPWIRDHTQKDLDEKYSKLSLTQRYMLDACYRLRGRMGRNLTNDPQWICSALAIRGQDRHNAVAALEELKTRGFLILTNQQVDHDNVPSDKSREDKSREEKPSRRQKPPADPRYGPFVDVLHRYWKKFVQSVMSFDDWFGDLGGRNLKSLLRQRKILPVEDFEKWLAHRARSPGVKHAQPVSEWICYITDYAEGPKGAGNGAGNSKAELRNADISQTTRSVFDPSRHVPGDAAKTVPDKAPG